MMDAELSYVVILFLVFSSASGLDVGLRSFVCSYFGFSVSLEFRNQPELIDGLNAKCANGTHNYNVRLSYF